MGVLPLNSCRHNDAVASELGVMGELETRDDAELLAIRGDGGEALAVFYRRYLDVVLGLCARRGLNAAEAADVTAETFAAVLLARGRFRPDRGSARSWLLGIASHKLADHARQRARQRRAVDRLAFELPSLTDRDYMDFADLVAQEDSSATTAALAELPESQRSAIESHVIDGTSYQAIAREHGISESVARQRVSRGLAALRLRVRKEQP